MKELNGKVKSGFGEGRFWTEKISKIFEEKYNIKLFFGTLNIELDEEYILSENEKILPNEYGGKYNVFIQECKIFEDRAYIVRPEINNISGKMHSSKIIEIVSNKNLRKKYNLKDNDKITICIE